MRLGALYGLAAAALFGLSAPIAKLLLRDVGPQLLAGLLYLGAGVSLSAWRLLRPRSVEAPLSSADAPAMLGVIVAGGVIAPVAMMLGLARTSGVAGSLLLNLEGPFTIALAVLVFREHLGRYGLAAVSLVLLGAAALRVELGPLAGDGWGALAIAAACALWAIDNNLTQRLALKDPVAIVRLKTLAAGAVNLSIALARGETLPGPGLLAVALALGALSYGASVVLDALALRLVGAAREAAYFATAPFVGALGALVILGEPLGGRELAAMALMAAGVALLLVERHAHEHAHEALEHAHLHRHDAHHQHAHAPDDPPGEPHAHAHAHAALIHAHAHLPDAHHRHRH